MGRDGSRFPFFYTERLVKETGQMQLSACLKFSESGPVVVTRNGKPVALIVGVADEDEIERLLMAYSPRLRASLRNHDDRFERETCLAMRNSAQRSERPEARSSAPESEKLETA